MPVLTIVIGAAAALVVSGALIALTARAGRRSDPQRV
jgi:hypothetical protein